MKNSTKNKKMGPLHSILGILSFTSLVYYIDRRTAMNWVLALFKPRLFTWIVNLDFFKTNYVMFCMYIVLF